LLAVVGVLLLNMGDLTASTLVRLFISIWVIAVLVFSSFAIGRLGSLMESPRAGGSKIAAAVAGFLAVALVFFIANDFLGGLVVAGYFLASGVAVAQLVRTQPSA
jgi:membrane-anchored protein YejM (alkaline phosphatase superfamily)